MYVFIFLVQFGKLSGRLLGDSCSLGLQYVFLVYPSVYGVGNLFLIAPFPDHYLFLYLIAQNLFVLISESFSKE